MEFALYKFIIIIKVTNLNLQVSERKAHPSLHNNLTDLFESVALAQMTHRNKGRAIGSNTIKTQKTREKTDIEKNKNKNG